ncbi:thiamine permease [Ochrobactrum sp. MR28]|nr:thiamine permease [Ochrobactrum sp. MR28]MBX8816301.1 thiamine permease [Ochrobactrum sp. MR31]
MSGLSNEAATSGYAKELVPVSEQGSGWKIFFIVAGSLCGLPVFILSAHIFSSLGFVQGMAAVAVGGVISGLLGAMTAFTGSKSRMGLALLADQAFGPWGASLVKLVIAISLIGWFGVNIGVLGVTAASALTQMTGYNIAALTIGLPVCLLIAGITLYGASGLERLGNILVPATLLVLIASLVLVAPQLGEVWSKQGNGAISFGGAVSAVVGAYVVGIVIQPDYGRFVRRPAFAAMGAGVALGIAYPVIMTMSSVASLASGTPEFISAMILLGFGLPALLVLLLGAWIDSSACLYSASLSLANQFPRFRFITIIAAITVVGVVLVIVGADKAFIPFLIALSVSLPPLATILVLSALLPQPSHPHAVHRAIPLVCWALATIFGLMTNYGYWSFSTLPTFDAVLISAVIFIMLRVAVSFAPLTSAVSDGSVE